MSSLSPNAQAILLLTAPLQIGRGRSSFEGELLSPEEYHRLAGFLHQQGWEPSDLDERADECEAVIEADRIQRLMERGFLLGQALDRWESLGIRAVTRADADYPKRLRARLKEAAPPTLYLCGSAELLEAGGWAVLGDDPERVPELAERACAAKRSILDCSVGPVALATLEAGGQAVAVLPDELARAAVVREHRIPLREQRLALISACDPSARATRVNAQLVFALADAALILTAKPPVREAARVQLELGWIPVYGTLKGARPYSELGA